MDKKHISYQYRLIISSHFPLPKFRHNYYVIVPEQKHNAKYKNACPNNKYI